MSTALIVFVLIWLAVLCPAILLAVVPVWLIVKLAR
jgi:hypothetical protein